MSIFQNKVLAKYLNSLDKEDVSSAYSKLKLYFHNHEQQEAIRNAKEEQFQEGFLKELFVNILGYTLFPTLKHNLITEQKNETDSKKADAAIIVNDKVVGVIELKGTDTVDLKSIENQAFQYKSKNQNCSYVITSNFEKLRYYIGDATNYLEFNLFTISENDFKILWLCLSFKSVEKSIPLKVKEDSIGKEDLITKNLYKDYSLFKRELYQNLISLNKSYDQLELFKKSQKLLDRFLFLFFAEDRGLLPVNSVRLIINDWNEIKERDEYTPLYDRFKKYFGYLNTGYKGRYDVFAYNGGLFKPDDVLDNVKIDDNILYEHTLNISKYDFESEVDVNILGHIFENSLNELDEIKAHIEGDKIEKSKTKRKKDGVFYTPKYITKYIVDNTLGKLCEDKKAELGLDKEVAKKEYVLKGKLSSIGKKYNDKITTYREWLLDLKICDPACGSGAFLNQAIEFLIEEHKTLDERVLDLQNLITGGKHQFSAEIRDISNEILEKNIYGVDINEESVEIAKLSLWLHSAQPQRKLNDLSNNIKCGNSLIDDVSIAGNKAFDWKNEFPKVFANGGFDVIIGNPPYVPTEYISEKDKLYLEATYLSAFGRINLYPIFYEKAIVIGKANSKIGYITPYTILKNQYYIQARKYILENTFIESIIDFKGVLVFSDAAVDSIIMILTKSIVPNTKILIISEVKDFTNSHYKTSNINQLDFTKKDDLSFELNTNYIDFDKLKINTIPLSEVLDFNQGIITGNNKEFITNEEGVNTKKIITGSDFNRYSINWSNAYIKYDESKLHRPRKKSVFEAEEKLLLRQTSSYPIVSYDNKQFYTLDTVHNGLLKNGNFNLKYFVTLLNSKLFRYLYTSSTNEEGKVFAQVKIIYVNPLPVKNISIELQQPFIEKADLMFKQNEDLQNMKSEFLKFLVTKFIIETPSVKLQNWNHLEFNDFIKELSKLKIKLNAEDEFNFMGLLEKQKKQANVIQSIIDAIDKEIDQMVYKLYELTEEEIKIVEES